jgi:hypothetical protein
VLRSLQLAGNEAAFAVNPFLCNNLFWSLGRKEKIIDKNILLYKNSSQYVITYHAVVWLTILKYLS